MKKGDVGKIFAQTAKHRHLLSAFILHAASTTLPIEMKPHKQNHRKNDSRKNAGFQILPKSRSHLPRQSRSE